MILRMHTNTQTHTDICIHIYIYIISTIYIYVFMAQRLVVPPLPRAGDGPYMICKLYIYTCVCVSTYVVCVCANVCSMYNVCLYEYAYMSIVSLPPMDVVGRGAGVGVVWGWGVTLPYHMRWGEGPWTRDTGPYVCIYIYIYLICLFIYSFRDAYIKQICTDAWKTMIKMFEQLYNIILSWWILPTKRRTPSGKKYNDSEILTVSISSLLHFLRVDISGRNSRTRRNTARTRSASVVSDCAPILTGQRCTTDIVMSQGDTRNKELPASPEIIGIVGISSSTFDQVETLRSKSQVAFALEGCNLSWCSSCRPQARKTTAGNLSAPWGSMGP